MTFPFPLLLKTISLTKRSGGKVFLNTARRLSSFATCHDRLGSPSTKTCVYDRFHLEAVCKKYTNGMRFNRQSAIQCFSTGCQSPDFEVDSEQLSKELAGKYLIDVRTMEEINEIGLIPGSVHIPVNEVEFALQKSDDVYENLYGAHKPDETGDNLIFYCRSGVRSLKSLTIARSLGYEKAKHLTGGFLSWLKYHEEDSKS